MVSTKLRYVLVVLFLSQLFSIKAQEKSFDLWHIGTLYLTDGDSLKGLLKYGSDVDLVQIKAGNKEFAFNYNQIDSFWIIDITDSSRRDFDIYAYKNIEGFERPLPFEMLVSNPKFKILTREVVELVSSGSMMYQGFATTRTITTQYYYLQGNQLLYFNASKRDVLEITNAKEHQILNYVKNNKLRYYRKSDIKLIFEFYYKLLEE